jgi:FlaA1/EpsC-like NDP-sugar epimerase
VPIVEYNVIKGIHNNVICTWNVAEAALENGVETFVLISTHKAVNPTNVMGATKRLAELVLQGLQERSATTRFLHGAIWQRARVFGLGCATLPRANSPRRARHGDPP